MHTQVMDSRLLVTWLAATITCSACSAPTRPPHSPFPLSLSQGLLYVSVFLLWFGFVFAFVFCCVLIDVLLLVSREWLPPSSRSAALISWLPCRKEVLSISFLFSVSLCSVLKPPFVLLGLYYVNIANMPPAPVPVLAFEYKDDCGFYNVHVTSTPARTFSSTLSVSFRHLFPIC